MTDSSTPTSRHPSGRLPHVAVVGAGPGGLAVARTLQRAGVPVVVFDADASLTARDQGGTLDLHADSGQIAIEDMGLAERFAALARPEGQSHRLLDPDGVLVREQIAAADAFAAPEIDRGQLRALLAEAVVEHDPTTIRWGRRVVGVDRADRPDRADAADAGPTVGGRTTLRFDDGDSFAADVVVGADGAWSRVRRALTDAVPVYSGVTFVEVVFTDVERRRPDVAELVGDGHMWANGDGRAIILQRNSGDVVRGYVGLRVGLDWLARAGIGAADGRGGATLDANATRRLPADAVERVRDELLRRFDGFAPELRAVIAESEGSLPNRPIFGMPTPTTWTHVAGIALVGDAAHVMAPFGGNGVNLAMLDGVELGHAIVAAHDSGDSVNDALREAEQRMLARSNPIAAGANAAIREHFAAGGPDVDGIPDWEDEARRWNERAAEYHSAQR